MNTARFLKYVWPFYSITHERVNLVKTEGFSGFFFRHSEGTFPWFVYFYSHLLDMTFLSCTLHCVDMHIRRRYATLKKQTFSGSFFSGKFVKAAVLWKSKARVTSYEFKSTSYEWVQIHELRVSSNPRVTTEFKSTSCEFKSTSYEFKSTS